MNTTTLILGAGFGGLSAARTLRSLVSEEHRIVLVDRSDSFHVGAGKNWVMLGDAGPEHISRPLRSLIPAGVQLLQTSVEEIDAGRLEVRTSDGLLRGDHLVIALGAELNTAAVPGLEHAEDFYSLEGAIRLRNVLASFGGGSLAILIVGKPFKCPPAPYEAAMLLHEHFEKLGMRERVDLGVYTFEGTPMSTAGPAFGAFMREQLAARDITYHPGRVTSRIDPERRRIEFEDGLDASYDLLLAVPPHQAPKAVRESSLVNEAGWIPVDSKTLRSVKAGGAPVYAVGDVTVVPLPGRYKPDAPLVLPKAGVMAAAHGEVVAQRIASRIRGETPTAVFDGHGFCFIETGGDEAVKGGGAFFDLPHPRFAPQAPDAAQHGEKMAWVKEWLRG